MPCPYDRATPLLPTVWYCYWQQMYWFGLVLRYSSLGL